jgi:trehalose synthase
MRKHSWLVNIEDYAPLIGEDAAERIMRKAQRLRDMHVLHVSSTFYGGGVAENALQDAEMNLTDLKKAIYDTIVLQNAMRMDLKADFVVVHDPQPLPLIAHERHACPWVWRCHVDLSNPNPEIWEYLRTFVEQYDAVVVSLPEYARELHNPQVFIMPAIDPFSIKNAEMSKAEVKDRLEHYHIPDDLPIVAQISRFDRWKDPEGVIEAFRIASKTVKATLVLLGNIATDDPEGQEVFESLLRHKSDRIHILTVEDSALVNALQRHAAVVLQNPSAKVSG